MNVLLCPLASPGFLYPMVGMALELQRRGHQVRFATGLSCSSALGELGLERLPRSEPDGDSFQLAVWAHPMAIAIQAKHVLHALERFPADVVVTSTLALGPILVGELSGLKVVVLGLAPYLWPVLDRRRGQLRSGDQDAVWRHREFIKHLNTARRLMSMPACDASLDRGSLLGSLYLLQTVPPFEPLAGLLPDTVRMVGSCVWDPGIAQPELEPWLSAPSDGTSLIYLQHGSVFNGGRFWEHFVSAVDGLPIRTAASLGRLRGAPPPAISDQFFIAQHMGQDAVLRRARAVVASGNTTAVLGALTHGLPMVLLPDGGEQRVLAGRCQEAGVAITLQPDVSGPPELRAALLRVLRDPAFTDRARLLQRAFAAAGGRVAAVEAVERRFAPVTAEVA